MNERSWQKTERLKVSENGRYLESKSGIPFFYLADTAWTIGNKLSPSEIDDYLKDRVSKGFTVIQMVLLDPETEQEIRSGNGHRAFVNNNILNIDREYWNYIDDIIHKADKMGLYVTLLPVWGQLVTGDDWSGNQYKKYIVSENAFVFGKLVGEHYKEYTNIIWCLGGDRHPIHKGIDYRGVWRRMAEGLAQGYLGESLQWNVESQKWKEILITYHPTISDDPPVFSSSEYLREDKWISFHMLQSGHRDNVRNYEQIYRDYNLLPVKPVLDGEANYEDWHFIDGDGEHIHSDWNVRKRGYWALFAGACGYTYGNACIWRMVKKKEKELDYTWKEALNRPGAVQMTYLKKFLLEADFFHMKPCQELLIVQDNYLDIRKEALVNYDYCSALIYLTNGGSVTISKEILKGNEASYSWLNPRNGEEIQQILLNIGENNLTFQAPTRGIGCDWLLYIKMRRHSDF